MFELRAATALARLWRDQGRHLEARDVLEPLYGWFTEGFDTVDLKESSTLLSQLNARQPNPRDTLALPAARAPEARWQVPPPKVTMKSRRLTWPSNTMWGQNN
jgi:hypothetical protein